MDKVIKEEVKEITKKEIDALVSAKKKHSQRMKAYYVNKKIKTNTAIVDKFNELTNNQHVLKTIELNLSMSKNQVKIALMDIMLG